MIKEKIRKYVGLMMSFLVIIKKLFFVEAKSMHPFDLSTMILRIVDNRNQS